MTDIVRQVILRIFVDDGKVYVINPEYVGFNTAQCTDIVLEFDDAGQFVTAQLVKRNEEQTSDGVQQPPMGALDDRAGR